MVNFPERFVLWRGMNAATSKANDLKVVFKELNETTIWLEVIAQSGSLPSEDIVAMVAENWELWRIITASIRTARAAIE